MFVLPLRELCITAIAENKNFFASIDPDIDLPKELIKRINAERQEKEAVLSNWQWFPAFPVAKSPEHGYTFILRRVQKEDEFELSTISKTIDFVKKKVEIKAFDLFTGSKGRYGRFIHLSCQIAENDRNKLGRSSESVKIARIEFPYEGYPYVKVVMTPLKTINDLVISKWSLETYLKASNFAIYYINQLFIDELKNKGSSEKTNERLLYASLLIKGRIVIAALKRMVARDGTITDSDADSLISKSLFGEY